MVRLSWIVAAMAANTLAAAALASGMQTVDGRWEGSIDVLTMHLQIAVEFETQGGVVTAKIDIPQQGVSGMVLQNVSFEAQRVHFELPAGAVATFDGNQVGDSIGGTFTQSGVEGSFSLNRVADAAAVAAPSRYFLAPTTSSLPPRPAAPPSTQPSTRSSCRDFWNVSPDGYGHGGDSSA